MLCLQSCARILVFLTLSCEHGIVIFDFRLELVLYVVPTGKDNTGRVKVPAGRYVIPTGKDNVIVSAGSTKVIPAGRTILVL
ncbi:hypothetical protein Tco_0177491, partial [Tanacetum coccineum]